MAEAGFLKAIYDSLAGFPVLQAAVGLLILIFGLRLMMKADKVKEAASSTSAPAPLPTLDATQLHMQGSVAFLDLMREKRDYLRDIRDGVERIAEYARASRDEAKRQTEILLDIQGATERGQSEQRRARQRQHDD